MANPCECTVSFDGVPGALAAVASEMAALAASEEATGEGQVPDGAEADGAMFALSTFEGGAQYETKGEPNHEAMRVMADRHGVGFVLTFHEPNDQRYGEVTYRPGELTGIELGQEDFDAYVYDEDDDVWSFEGDTYDSELDVLAMLLDRHR